MANMASNRIKREFVELPKDDGSNELFFIEPVKNNLLELKGHIVGPVDTPFDGGVFNVEIKIPETYPFNAPKVRFTTRIWHPNISSVTGAICLDILKDRWAAAMTLRTVLLSIQALLASPEPDDPQDAIVARQYKDHPENYRMTARYWTYFFASDHSKLKERPSHFKSLDEKIDKLVEMSNSDRTTALSALSQSNWNLETALQCFMS